MTRRVDELDLAPLRLLIEQPRAGTPEYARILGVARGTVQSRIARLESKGTRTELAMRERVPYRVLPLLREPSLGGG